MALALRAMGHWGTRVHARDGNRTEPNRTNRTKTLILEEPNRTRTHHTKNM